MSNFTITSPEFQEQDSLQHAHEFNGFDGSGDNRSPALRWQGAPEGTQSFAVTLYDPDAPTGSGFWHWVVCDIPPDVTELAASAGSGGQADLGGKGTQVGNDYGATGYGGPCPPKGSPAHRYIFTVHALGVPKLGLPAGTTNAVVRFMIHQNSLASASLTALYKR
ncbi:YbhB/YbcL family Raf kinase inhibitor-like protein [Ramlibacter sp.]|uniref:YbhB/YbcL family Raf kinase inhibitor-like protein n=1 Tax=Ramlibacter sp. TaxID=1917967 RepID=UPI0017A95B29|nr:YbhB/YbcL family Raf kinase inhibitor-like protein [Ramlibacter sp.]MBA2674416.1 YbhB/YbcL family Raf kinase inhibitor-like protein [Ramlibacter sp.]